MPNAINNRLLHAILACFIALSNFSLAQDVVPATFTAPAVSADRIAQIRNAIEASVTLSEENRTLALDACRKALAELQFAGESTAKSDQYAGETETIKDRVASEKIRLEEPLSPLPNVVDIPLIELEQSLSKLEIELANYKKKLAGADLDPQSRSQRRKEIRTRISVIQEQLQENASKASLLIPSDVLELEEAKRAERAARRFALLEEIPALESELAKYDAEDAVNLLRLQYDVATRRASHTEKVIKLVKDQIKLQREAAAEDSVRKARVEAIVATPALKSYAERNHQLTETAQEIAHKLSQAEFHLKISQDAYTKLNSQLKLTRKKVDMVGLTSAVGALLRKQRLSLPETNIRQASVSTQKSLLDENQFRQLTVQSKSRELDLTERKTLLDETQYLQFEYEDERKELDDIDALVQTIIAESGVLEERRIAFLESASREMLNHKRGYLDSLLTTLETYFNTLVELDTKDRQFVSLSNDYASFIDERVLWIRSGKLLTKDFGIDDSDTWMVSSAKWFGLATGMAKEARSKPVTYGLVSCLFVLLLFYGRRLRNRLRVTGEVAAKVNCRSIGPTLDATLSTFLISLVWPALCVLLAWRIGRLEEQGNFAVGVSQGLLCLGLLWAPLELFRQVCRPRGLGEAHFAWSPAALQSIRRRLRWFTVFALPFAFLTAAFFAIDTTHGRDSIERICFIAGMLALGIFAFGLFGSKGVLKEQMAYHPSGWSNRLRHVWPWLAAAVPVSLAGLAFSGYYYTAQVLSWRLFATCCFMAGLVILRSMLLRLLFLRRRALSIDQARERAAAASAAAAASGEAAAASAVASLVTETPQADLSAHSQQTRRLVTTGMFAASVVGMWLIWVQVLPALGMLDRYPLWSNSSGAVVAQAASSPMSVAMPMSKAEGSSNAVVSQSQGDETVTLSDLVLAILIGFVTFVLARNGPGLLEISVLQQLPLDASVRYAITTLVSYAIVLIGVIVSCSTIGLQWSQVQWLATALTFGLAFGLQEIFANFVAGLIILLERPIRVGDVVTIDDVSGVVSKIRIRATSITNWDRKEYVVPNKEFITGRLLNWTLSDKVNRIVINIGVAYGSDTERARELLLEAANSHPLVLKDPASAATFDGFGDNSLNLTLRTYLATLDDRLEVIHQLHTNINLAFQAEKIEIAFPQRDLHIRTAPEALKLALDAEHSPASEANEAA